MDFFSSHFKTQHPPTYSALTGDNDDDHSNSNSRSSTDHTDSERALKSELDSQRHSRRMYRTPSIQTIITISLLTMATLLATAIYAFFPSSSSSSSPPLSCGNTLSSALARNCVFDILGYAWTPAACHDTATAAEFLVWLSRPDLEHGAFPFFEDSGMQVRVAGIDALARRVAIPTYAPQQEHLAHCVFSARRTARLAEMPGIRSAERPLEHRLHCSREVEALLTDGGDGGTSAVHVGFATC